MKLGSKTLAVILLLIGLVLVNYLASSVPARLDLTAQSIYSLSPGTKAMLGKIEEPITLELYFSENATGLPIAYKNYATRVQEMLRQYVRNGGGNLTLNVINPRPDTPEEERATAAGLTPQIAQTGGEQFFFGLVVTQADQQKNIPAFTPQREQFLEYDLSKLIHGVQQFDKPKLGLLTSLPLQGSNPQEMQMMMMTGRQPQPSQFIVEEWRQSFELVRVEPTATELPADLDALAVIHPQNLSSTLQFAIDQFLLNGGPVFLCVDPSSEYFKRQSGRQAMMMGGAQPNVSSDLPTLLSAWGLTYNSQNVVGDLANATQVQAQPGTLVRYPVWPSLRTENFNSTSLPTAQLNSMLFIEPGSITLNSDSSLTFTPLIESSAQSGDVLVSSLQFAQPDDVSRQLTVSGKKTLAALVTGKFKTAFPNGAPQDEPESDEQKSDAPQKASNPDDASAQPSTDSSHLGESKSTSTLLIVADTDWLFDDYSVRKFNFFGQTAAEPFNDNLAFAANAVDFLAGSQDLVSIRGKGTSFRPFDVVRRMEVEAQQQYREKLTDLEARLQTVQTQLSELRSKQSDGNRLIASPEVTKAIEDYQQQSASLRSERREIRRALREDIDALENRLLITNLIASPLLIGAFGLWFHRSRRR